jgi:murein DD-endopeptidase MepM/ murein hydrolase activator NlpD
MTKHHLLRSLSILVCFVAIAPAGCALGAGASDDEIEPTALEPLAAQNAFCPTGFAFDSANNLCLSATEAAGPFPRSMIDFCKRFVANRSDGTNACETTIDGKVNTRWARSLATSGRTSTLQSNGCARGTSPDATTGYCSDGPNIYGPFSKDDVAFCKAKAGGNTCETNRIAPSFAQPKNLGGEWSYIMAVDHGVRNDVAGRGHFGATRSNSAGTHSGIDFLAAVGTPLLSACDSNDVQTGSDPGGFGSWVQISCAVPTRLTGGQAMWASTFYAHLSSVSAISGGSVRKGQVIGAVGKSGNASASDINAHVHWEVTIHGSQAAAHDDFHGSADNSDTAAGTAFASTFRSACLTPNGISAVTGPVMRGRRPDPYLMLVCTVTGKPAITAAPSVQSTLERWSNHFTAAAFDINVGR